MAGHSHWAGIKHKKALIDNRRGKLWSKLSKAIIIAAKAGGGDPATNLRLRYAINDAKAVSVPKDNIERAIKKGTGELEGANFEEVLYEGYGPAGVAVLCDILTDNRNRTAGEVRKLFEIAGGKLGATGCVAWMFDRKGLLVIPADQTDEDTLMEMALEAGADDVRRAGENFEVICDPDVFTSISEAIDSAVLKTELRQITRNHK
jgi:YebC/PmpR family DNA-binding regulatory protein